MTTSYPAVFSCGSNGSAQLSLGHANDVYTLQQCRFHPNFLPQLEDAKIIDLVSSSTHSLLLLSIPLMGARKNILFGAGTNTMGQLGPRCELWDEKRPELRWKVVDLLGPAGMSHDDWEPVRVAVTWTTSFVVYQKVRRDAPASSSGESEESRDIVQIVLACGSNDFGELGEGAAGVLDGEAPISKASAKPTVVDLGLRLGESVEMIKGGQRHVLAVISNGRDGQRVSGWGASRKGELQPSVNDLASPSYSGVYSATSSRPSAAAKRKAKGKAAVAPTSSPPTTLELPIPQGTRIVDIALGASHSVALFSNGCVAAWGSNAKGQVGDLEQVGDIIAIAATWGGTYLLTRNGELWSQGANSHSQLLRHDDASRGRFNLPEGWTPRRLVAGSEHILVHAFRESAQAAEEGLWVGGWNEHGNLGLGHTLDRGELVRVDLRQAAKVAGLVGRIRICRVWGGCAATWVAVDAAA
jgi:protein ATS1